MKTITDKFTGELITKTDLPFTKLYDFIKITMPHGNRWIVNTGKTKREYFWFYGNQFQGNKLSFIGIN
jgi:hypothetical protein